VTQSDPKIRRAELEGKFKALQDDIQGTAKNNKSSIATYAAIASGAVVILAYAFGRRSGRKRRSVLEIRR
jgi:hypothetical protein